MIENKPGAGGNVAAEEMIKSTPDGYTLYMVPPAVAANAALYPHLNFVFLRDATAVAGVVRVPNVAEVNPSLPVKTIPELIAYAKANPGKLSFELAGIGTASHLAGQLFNAMTGANMQHVPYRGDGPAMVDLIAGQVQVGFATMTASIGHIRSGQLRALAVTTLKRSDALPGVPTVAETVPGFRGELVVRHRCAERHARRHYRTPQPRDSMPALPIRRSRRGSTTWAAWRSPARRRTSAS